MKDFFAQTIFPKKMVLLFKNKGGKRNEISYSLVWLWKANSIITNTYSHYKRDLLFLLQFLKGNLKFLRILKREENFHYNV